MEGFSLIWMKIYSTPLSPSRPFKQNYGELVGFELRARHIVSIAEESLADWQLPEKQTFVRFVRREPLGVTFVLTPWNYPYMCTVHTLITSVKLLQRAECGRGLNISSSPSPL